METKAKKLETKHTGQMEDREFFLKEPVYVRYTYGELDQVEHHR